MTPVRRAVAYFRQDRRLIGGLVLLVALSLGVSLLAVWPVGIAIDVVFNRKEASTFFHRLFLGPLPESPLGQLIGLTLISFALVIAQEGAWFFRQLINYRLRLNGLARVRTDLYTKLQDLPADYHRNHPQGDAIYRLSTDSQGFFGVLDTLIGMSIACVTLPAITLIMLSRNVSLTLLAMTIVPLLVLANRHFSRTVKTAANAAKRAETDFTTTTQRSVAGIGLIQAFCRQATGLFSFRRSVDDTNAAYWNLNYQECLYPFVRQGLFALGGGLILSYGGYLVITSKLSVAELMAFMGYLVQLWDPLGRIVGFRTNISTNIAAVERVSAVLDTPVTIADPPSPVALELSARTLTLSNVCFHYPANSEASPRTILRGITATIQPGEFAAFIGPSGTGKSTLLSLLGRFYDPTSGKVMLDSHDLRTLALSDVRRHVAIVPQDAAIFPGTIADNIAYGRPAATMAEVMQAAQDAGADSFIAEFPNGYETPITECAGNLSGGQRQRLAIARALLTGAPILVLDEPTSALDPAHASHILATLESLRGKRTIILVTHNLASVASADQIYLLANGHVGEHGTHAQLMAKRGEYHKLVASQRDTIEQAA